MMFFELFLFIIFFPHHNNIHVRASIYLPTLITTFTLSTLALSSENVLHRNTTYVQPSESHRRSEGCGFESRLGTLSKNSSKNIIIAIIVVLLNRFCNQMVKLHHSKTLVKNGNYTLIDTSQICFNRHGQSRFNMRYITANELR